MTNNTKEQIAEIEEAYDFGAAITLLKELEEENRNLLDSTTSYTRLQKALDRSQDLEEENKKLKEWQPISTAPDNYDDILVYNGYSTSIAKRQGSYTPPSYYLTIHGSLVYDRPEDGGRCKRVAATHWMPLPTKPESNEQ